MIRKAEKKDLAAIVDMSREFWGHTIYHDVEFCDEDVSLMVENCITNGIAYVYDNEGPKGFICAIIGPLLANFGVSIATEVAWWVNEDFRDTGAGVGLVKAMENNCMELGVKYASLIYMKSSMPESLKRLYVKMGYSENETNFTRGL